MRGIEALELDAGVLRRETPVDHGRGSIAILFPRRDLGCEGLCVWDATIATRFYRWRRAGIWDRILADLQQQADAAGKLDWTLHHVDGTMIRAHQHAAGAQKRGSTT